MKRPLLRTIVKPLYLAWASDELLRQPKPDWYSRRIPKNLAQDLVRRLPQHYRTQIRRFKKTEACLQRHGLFQRLMLADKVRSSPGVLEQFASKLLPGIGFHSNASVSSDDPACGSTFLGGCPDFPPGQSWPENSEGPLRFLGQFNLADISTFDLDDVLPMKGLIQFFVGAGNLPSGFERDDKNYGAVLGDFTCE